MMWHGDRMTHPQSPSRSLALRHNASWRVSCNRVGCGLHGDRRVPSHFHFRRLPLVMTFECGMGSFHLISDTISILRFAGPFCIFVILAVLSLGVSN